MSVRDVAVVGGGVAGAAVATRLARAGLDVVVLERTPAWHWRAAGVFASPLVVDALRRTGLADPLIDRIARRIPAMRLSTPNGSVVALTYGAERGGPLAVGLDRSGLDPALVELAWTSGAEIRRGVTVTGVHVDGDGARLTVRDGDATSHVEARVVVGADGPRSVVGRAVDVHRPVRLSPRVGLSFHLPDPRGDAAVDARLAVFGDGYVGIAPVPGARVNVGIVLGPTWRAALRSDGAEVVSARVLGSIAPTAEDPLPWRTAIDRPTDEIAGAAPLGIRATRRAGHGWFLVGDAAGFLDPLSGEGLHRALVSAELAAPAIVAAMRRGVTPARAAAAYDRAMQRRFAAKDGVSWLLQAFLARPVALEYAARRLVARPDARATMGLVMGDLIPAGRALDPRFLAAVLRP